MMDARVEHTDIVSVFRSLQHSDSRIVFISGKEDETEVTFAELHDTALRHLAWLQRLGVRKNSRCVLFLRDNVRFSEFFWACLLGGAVPVPIATGNAPEHRAKALEVLAQLGDAHLITDTKNQSLLEEFVSDTDYGSAPRTSIQNAIIAEKVPSFLEPAKPSPGSGSDIAFIQYSSGSTRSPKGVVITHDNLYANAIDLIDAFGFGADETSLSWMPLSHDMGLVGFHICPIAAGMTHYIMDTSLFTRRPLLWLEKASEKQASVLCSPNFGYRHFLNAFERKGFGPVDLSPVRQIVNGAEPISHDLVKQFLETLAPSRLDPKAMCPAYGMAEATLGLCVAEKGTGSRTVTVARSSLTVGQPVVHSAPEASDTVTFAIEGFPFPNTEVRIENAPSDGYLGEIQIRGPNVTSGYVGGASENDDLFTTDGWLKTGDLGFFHAGELVVTGRIKDIIFIEGQNFYPHDIEAMIESAGLVRLGEVTVCAAPRNDQDSLLVFVRSREDGPGFSDQAEKIARCVFKQAGLTVSHVLPTRQLPKTTSGKIRRFALAAAFLAGDYDSAIEAIETSRVLSPEAAPVHSGSEAIVLGRVKELFDADIARISDLTPATNLFDLDVTSAMLADLADRLKIDFGDAIDVTDFFENTSVSEIATLIDQRRNAASSDTAGA